VPMKWAFYSCVAVRRRAEVAEGMGFEPTIGVFPL